MQSNATLPRLLEPLNELLVPGIRIGVGNPLPLTSGFVVLEVVGRRTGELRSVPLLCTDYGRALLVSTVRSNSQWLKNLAVAGEASVWLRGRRYHVKALVYERGQRLTSAAATPAMNEPLATFGRSWSRLTGTSLAILLPERSRLPAAPQQIP